MRMSLGFKIWSAFCTVVSLIGLAAIVWLLVTVIAYLERH